MKYFAIISVLVLLASLVLVGTQFMTSNIYIEAAGVTTLPAKDQEALFASLRDQLRLDAVVGTPFVSTRELGEAEDYQFCLYTVRIRNNCRIPAELAELRLAPVAGDVMLFTQNDYLPVPTMATVPPGGTAEVAVVLLTSHGNHTVRDATVSCYMWGKPFTLQTRMH